MILKGEKIFSYLAREVRENDDPSESSHWKKFHANFQFTGDGFKGLSGFGGCVPPYKGFKKFWHSIMQKPFISIGKHYARFHEINELAKVIVNKQVRAYDLDVLRQVISLSMLFDKTDNVNHNSLVIGDGFASMTSLIQFSRFSKNTILINLTKTLIVDLWYLRMALGIEEFDEKVVLITSSKDLEKYTFDKGMVIAIEAKNQDLIKEFEIGVAINIASMQEMNINIVKKYVSDMRLTKRAKDKESLLFYCCNRVEKRMPGGEISRIDDYGWLEEDEFVFDELCPWHQKFYSRTPPFYHKYDGPTQHRLVKLKLN